MAHHLSAAGLGTISEIFDGDAPFTARGAFAQAWSVAEILRAWRACYDAGLRLTYARLEASAQRFVRFFAFFSFFGDCTSSISSLRFSATGTRKKFTCV